MHGDTKPTSPAFQSVIKKKTGRVKDDGYYSKLVKNYPKEAGEVGYTSHVAKKYPNWRAL
jgi:hypothetical protein|tara:strand:+ start:229 stop:408 length:180 start_codon:yes stop_codon:yes gene_type:complete